MESIRDRGQSRGNEFTDWIWDRLEAGEITTIPDQLLQEHEIFRVGVSKYSKMGIVELEILFEILRFKDRIAFGRAKRKPQIPYQDKNIDRVKRKWKISISKYRIFRLDKTK